MSVKSENVDHQKEQITDDISEMVVEDRPETNEVDGNKLAALRAKLAASTKAEEPIEVEDLSEVGVPEKRRSLKLGVAGSGQAGCVDGDTNLYISNYGVVPIKNLFYDAMNSADLSKIDVRPDSQICIDVSNRDMYTVSMDPETGEFKRAKVLAIWKNRKNSKNKITTSTGMYLTCSKMHRSLVFRPYSKRKAFFSSLSSSNPLVSGDRLIDSRLSIIDLISSETNIRNIKVSNEIAWLLGLFAGDGHNKLSGNEISFYCDNEAVIKKAVSVLEKLPCSSISQKQQPGCMKVSAFGLPIRLFFETAFGMRNDATYGGTGRKTYSVGVPTVISSANSEIRASFIAGLIDSDGTIEKRWCKTSIGTTSKNMADQVSCLASTIGARTAVDIADAHVSNSGKNHSKLYTIRFSGKINHGPMLPFIVKQMAHSVKKEKLINWLNTDQQSFATSSVPLLFDEIVPWMKTDGGMTTVNNLSVKSGHSLKMWARDESKLSIPTFNDMLSSLEQSDQCEYVGKLSSKLLEISSIEEVDSECEFFDLTVEKYENYFAGNFGFIVTHNSRLAECFFSLGYDALAFNTAQQDLEHIKMPQSNKIMLDYGLGGASKDPSIGHEAAQMHRDLINSKIRDHLIEADVFVFCTSLGGGSGGGSIDVMLDVMSAIGKPIIVITVLPMTNEDAQTKKNSLDALGKLAKKIQENVIHNLIVVDNAKIETIFSDVGPMQFYQVSNKAIVDPLDVFNTYSSAPSNVKSLDPMEFGKILIDGGGLSLYGSMTVANYQEDTALAEAIITNLTSGLLAEGFNLKQSKYCGVMFLANKKVWESLPSASINYAMSMVQDHAGTPLGVFRGIYEADIPEDVVKVYSFFSGLALPDSRVDELKIEVAAHSNTLKEKDVQRNMNLTIDTGESETLSAAEKIKSKIKAKASPFGKFTKGVVDKRK